jgi:hypothetical protein
MINAMVTTVLDQWRNRQFRLWEHTDLDCRRIELVADLEGEDHLFVYLGPRKNEVHIQIVEDRVRFIAERIGEAVKCSMNYASYDIGGAVLDRLNGYFDRVQEIGWALAKATRQENKTIGGHNNEKE